MKKLGALVAAGNGTADGRRQPRAISAVRRRKCPAVSLDTEIRKSPRQTEILVNTWQTLQNSAKAQAIGTGQADKRCRLMPLPANARV